MEKKKKVIIIGFGGHAKVILNILERDYGNFFDLIGYVDIEEKESDLNYIGDDEKLKKLYEKGICKELIIGIGKMQVESKREKLIEDFLKIGFKFPKIISKKSIINKNVKIGKGTQVLDNVLINCNSKIGKFCIINSSAVIEHDVLVGDYTHVAPGAVICGGSKIGKNCFIGANSTIVQSVKVCKNVLIGSGSLVQKDIKESGVYVGNPLVKIR